VVVNRGGCEALGDQRALPVTHNALEECGDPVVAVGFLVVTDEPTRVQRDLGGDLL
jgi:NADPH-dependent ferric siderophore reductase